MIQNTPLAERVRPRTIDDYIGQEHLLGENKSLRKALESGRIPSIILWGPPGVGKTTLARIIADKIKKPFHILSATDAGVKQVREVIEKAEKAQFMGHNNAILFIDEIHRFNKSQQDSLLKAVEQGTVTLIGATTENPSFEVNAALLSRCEVYVLKQLESEHLMQVAQRAIETDSYLKTKNISIQESDALLVASGGDARRLLNTLEIIVNQCETDDVIITNELVADSIQKKLPRYDKKGEQHYDIVSAFIKSIRGSDPNATVYWLSRMIEGGEDPVFIARRMIIAASEDIGNANPTALVMATTCMQAVQAVGYPECRIVLSQVAIYLACSPKSNASYLAIGAGQKLVQETGDLEIPLHLRNAPSQLMKSLNYSKGYQYAHNHQGSFVFQQYLPNELEKTVLYKPGNNAREKEFEKRLASLWRDHYDYSQE